MPANDKYLSSFIRSCLDEKNGATALKDSGGASVSFQKLYQSCFLSNFFTKNFNSNETVLIAVFSEKRASTVELFFSILTSGNAYLPLDYLSPPERICYILKDSGCKALLVDKAATGNLLSYLKEKCTGYEISDHSDHYFLITFDQYRSYDNRTAYVIYTSGSTGFPKGVIHTHQSAMAFINWCLHTFQFKAGSKFISIAPFSFDLSVLDIYVSLGCQGTLFIPTYSDCSNVRAIRDILVKESINVIYSTPSFYRSLLLYGKIENSHFKGISHVLYAGEQLYYDLVRLLTPHFPNAVQYNLYGPTETNVCSYYKIENGNNEEGAVPIGLMCSYAKGWLRQVNETDHELLVASESLMLDYVKVPAAFEIVNGLKYYNTGDIVTKNKEGVMVFKGRADKMIKRNGYRIEQGEIESCLSAHNSIKEFAVKMEDNEGVKIKVFYTSEKEVSELELKNYFLSKLPAYMLPDSFTRLDSIQKNSNFKTDLNKL